MYLYRYSKMLGLLVGMQTGHQFTPPQVDDFIDAVMTLDREGLSQPNGVVAIHIVSPESPRPNSTARRKIADARKSVQGKVFFSLVTPSTLVRSVITALNWLHPPPENYQNQVHSNFEEAVKWAEEKRGQKLPYLYELFNEVQAMRIQRLALGA